MENQKLTIKKLEVEIYQTIVVYYQLIIHINNNTKYKTKDKTDI